MKLNGNQPFYSVLPDEPDCERLFNAVRTSKYVAQVCLHLSNVSFRPTSASHMCNAGGAVLIEAVTPIL